MLTAANEQVEASAVAVEGAERERGLGLRSTLDVLDAEEVTVVLGDGSGEAVFQTTGDDGRVVLDGGRVTYTA